MEPVDLNDMVSGQYLEGRDNGCRSGTTEVVFRDYKAHLLQLFRHARREGWVCFGLVAWLTEPRILDAMSKIPTAIIVQKEDFLRPDLDDHLEGREPWTARLRRQYRAIEDSDQTGGAGGEYFQRQHMPYPLCAMSESSDPGISGVRCFGVSNDRGGDPHRRRPLMHSKFLTFAELALASAPGSRDESPGGGVEWQGRALWTGSCNLSRMSMRSIENALVIRDPVIANAYVREWALIAALSEPLDWNSEWADPQWRLGS